MKKLFAIAAVAAMFVACSGNSNSACCNEKACADSAAVVADSTAADSAAVADSTVADSAAVENVAE